MKSKNIGIEELRDMFHEIKKSVLKKCPGATTKIDSNGKFYVVDKNGYRILKDMLLYPAQDSVFDAWYMVDHVLKVEKIIADNTKRFSDEKIYKRLEKEGD